MVIKGGARAEAGKLAFHLLRVDTNEQVRVLEMAGVVAPDLTAALLEMEAVASAARSRRPFYHASINTRADELMTDAQKVRTIDRLEQELGLTGQPRVVVEHVKDGREHMHVAWSRIDAETMHAVPDSHNYRRHEIVARELEREFEHARVQGAHHERDGVERPARCPSHAETRQAERSGISPEDAKAQLRDLWQSADNGQAFAAALDNAGWTLARGDRRGFVALDPTGEIRAVNKDITGLSAAKVRDRLADVDLDRLPSVDQARDEQRTRQAEAAPALTPEIDHEADELARLEAMAAEYDQQEPNDGHGYGDGIDLPTEWDAAAEARTRADVDAAAFAAEVEKMGREIVDLPQDKPRDTVEPDPAPVRLDTQSRDQVDGDRSRLVQFVTAGRARLIALADRLEQAFEAVQGRIREREPVAAPVAQPEPAKPAQPPEKVRGGLFGWFARSHTPAPATELAADRQHHAARVDRQPVHVITPAAKRPAEPQKIGQPEPPRPRPVERAKRSLWDQMSADADSRIAEARARETPTQRADREQQEREREAERLRGSGDGSRDRTRYHHRGFLWELLGYIEKHHHRRNEP